MDRISSSALELRMAMALIDCPDCGRQVSDRAPACIHCGAPLKRSLAERLRKATADLASEARGVASAGLRRARKEYTEAVDALQARREARRAAAVERLRLKEAALAQRAEAVAERVDRERWREFDRLKSNEFPVPVFLMPTGTGPEDYIVLYRFAGFLDELRTRRFLRPKLQVWACREDISRYPLATSFTDTFIKQLRAQREGELQKTIATMEQHEKASKLAGLQAGSAATMAGGAALLMLAVANPLFDLALLVFAVFGGSAAGVELIKKFRSQMRRGMTEAEIETARTRLAQDLADRRAEIGEAIERLQICVHPRLFAIYEAMCELEGEPWPPKPKAMHPAPPSIDDELASAAYREALPQQYAVFVEAES